MTKEQIERFIKFLNYEDGEILSFEYRGYGLDKRDIRVTFRRKGTQKSITGFIKQDGKLYEKQDVSLDE